MNDGGAKEPVFKHLACIIMAQMSVKASIKKHGKLDIDASFNKCFLLDDKNVFEGIKEIYLTSQQK